MGSHPILYAHAPGSLHLPELLYNFFGHLSAEPHDCHRLCLREPAALARTCRTFKEPALGFFDQNLPALSILARCVPDAICSPKSCVKLFLFFLD